MDDFMNLDMDNVMPLDMLSYDPYELSGDSSEDVPIFEKMLSNFTRANDINKRDRTGKTALHRAASTNDLKQIEKLLSDGASVNARDSKSYRTPLHDAAIKNNNGNNRLNAMKLLLKNGADVNAKTTEGDTPLHYLMKRADTSIIKLFLEFGANVKLVNNKEENLLFPAVGYNYYEDVVQLLIDLGLNVNQCNTDKKTPLHEAARNSKNVNFQKKVLEMLIKAGANINARDKDDKTPLYYWVKQSNFEAINLLLKADADLNVLDINGENLIVPAIVSKHVGLVQQLIDEGLNVNNRSTSGITPMHRVAMYMSYDKNYLQIAEVLLKNGADINARDKTGLTPLWYLIQKDGNFEAVQLFLNFDADVYLMNELGENMLFPAANFNKNVDVLQLLIDLGLDVNHRSTPGLMPLIVASNYKPYKSLKIVKCLLKNDDNMNAVGRRGATPLYEVMRTIVTNQWSIFDSAIKKKLHFIVEHTDFSLIPNNYKILSINYKHHQNDLWQYVLKHFAKLLSLDISLHQSIVSAILKQGRYINFLKQCQEELLLAKSSKLPNSWLSFYDLLVVEKKKLKNYGGNSELIENLKTIDCKKKFPIFGAEIDDNMKKGIARREVFDESAIKLSDCLPIFNPNHLILRDILDCMMTKEDLFKFCEKKRPKTNNFQ